MSIILHISCRNIDLSKKGYCSLERRVRHLEINAHCTPSKGMVQLFKEYFMFCLDIAPAKTHCISPKEDYSYSERYTCF